MLLLLIYLYLIIVTRTWPYLTVLCTLTPIYLYLSYFVHMYPLLATLLLSQITFFAILLLYCYIYAFWA